MYISMSYHYIKYEFLGPESDLERYCTVKINQRETDHIPQWKKPFSPLEDNAYLAHLVCVFPIVMDTTLL
eukprot:COSAG02_NODE_6715_length_3404_cov_6.886233_1_plen_70_part_00